MSFGRGFLGKGEISMRAVGHRGSLRRGGRRRKKRRRRKPAERPF